MTLSHNQPTNRDTENEIYLEVMMVSYSDDYKAAIEYTAIPPEGYQNM